MSAEAICLYALCRQEKTEHQLREVLLEAGLPNGYEGLTETASLKSELAGILFGVSKNKGMQLLLGPEIQAALRTGSGDDLNKLIKQHKCAFWIAWAANKSELVPSVSHTDEYKIQVTRAIHDGMIKYKPRIFREIDNLTEIWKGSAHNWKLKEIDYTDSIRQLVELQYSGKEKVLSWLSDTVSLKLRETIQGVSGEDFAHEALPNLYNLLELLKQNNKPQKRLCYGVLDAIKWAKWCKELESQNLDFPSVLPAKGAIERISSNTGFDASALDTDHLKLLQKTLKIYPDSDEWNAVVEEACQWGRLAGRNIGDKQYYEFLLQLMSVQKITLTKPIKETLGAQDFWYRSDDEDAQSVLGLPVLAAIGSGEELQNSQVIGSNCKEFWATEQDNEVAESVYTSFKKAGELDVLWDLLVDDTNKLAFQIARDVAEDEFFGLAHGTHRVDEISWADEDEIRLVVGRLCENGSVQHKQDDMRGRALTYHKVFHYLKLYGSTDAQNFVDEEIQKVSKEDWVTSLAKQNHLLKYVNINNHKFSDAFVEYFSTLFTGKLEETPDSSVWGAFGSLLEKTCDANSVICPNLTKVYFEAEEDHLDNTGFRAVSPSFSSCLHSTPFNAVMLRLCKWIDSNMWERIEWLLASQPSAEEPLLDGFISRVKEGLQSDDEKGRDTCKRLVEYFEIEILAPSLPDIVEGEETAEEAR
jgi:hypothetical protein